MFDELKNELSDRLRLFTQANVLTNDNDARSTLSVFDLQECLDLIDEHLADQLIPEFFTFEDGKEVQIGGANKYRKDHNYERFWTDVDESLRELIEAHFQRRIQLSTGTKWSSNPMAKRFGAFIIGPMVDEFRRTHPENVMVSYEILTNALRENLLGIEVRTHSDDVLVARQMMQARVKKEPLSEERRLSIIRNAAEKYRDINTLDIHEESSDETIGDFD